MGQRLTEIHLPHEQASVGIAEWGEQPADVMLTRMREYAAHLRAQADAVERAADHEFQIQSYSGVHVQRKCREIQRSSRLAAALAEAEVS